MLSPLTESIVARHYTALNEVMRDKQSCFADLKVVKLEIEPHTSVNNLRCAIIRFRIFTSDNEDVLESRAIRYLYTEKELWHRHCETSVSVLGRVAWNQLFKLESDYRCGKIAPSVYQIEESLYKAWGADEIQMVAAWWGREYWRKLGFEAHCEDLEILLAQYEDFTGVPPRSITSVDSILLFPEDFLRSEYAPNNIRLYKVLK